MIAVTSKKAPSGAFFDTILPAAYVGLTGSIVMHTQ